MSPKGLLDFMNKQVFKRHQGREQQLLELLELIVAARGDIKEKEKIALVDAFRLHLPRKDSIVEIVRTTSVAPDALQWIFEENRSRYVPVFVRLLFVRV